MRPSSLGGGRILRRTLSVRMSVCPSVRPSRYRSLPSVTSRHLANYNDTHVRAAYRTAISAAQILVLRQFQVYVSNLLNSRLLAKRVSSLYTALFHQIMTM